LRTHSTASRTSENMAYSICAVGRARARALR
jgi:hypothetical protein